MNENRWTSTTDELPPLGKRVRVKSPYLLKATVAARRTDGLSWSWFDDGGNKLVGITRWQKIPKGMDR